MGVSAACHVFVNGRLTGFTQGSALPAEFDITSNLHEGDNEIFILIYPRCTGSYLEKTAERTATRPDSRCLAGSRAADHDSRPDCTTVSPRG
ncbi:MAG: sugar-binding domain-containing protein [Saccharofermentanales bacterium]